MKYFGNDVLNVVNGGTSANTPYNASESIQSPYLNLPDGKTINTMEELNELITPGTYKVMIQSTTRSVYLNPLLRAVNGFRMDQEIGSRSTASIGGSVLVFNTNDSSSEEATTVHQIIIGDVNGEFGMHYRSVSLNEGISRAGFTGVDFSNATKGFTTEQIKEVILEVIPTTENGIVYNAVNAEAAETATYAISATEADTLSKTLTIDKGGTGAENAEEACTNIGALPITGGNVTGDLSIKGTNVLEQITALSKVATSSANGLMSAADKVKLDSMDYRLGVENGIPYVESI